MKCLVTGATGFIGSHLAKRLITEGHEVIGIDCFVDYYPRKLKNRGITELQKRQGFKFIEANLLSIDLGGLISDASYMPKLWASAQSFCWAIYSEYYQYINTRPDCILVPGFFKCQEQTLLVFSIHLVFNQPAVKPSGFDRFFP